MRKPSYSRIVRWAALAALALDAAALPAQHDPWRELVAQADSVGPETPRITPGREVECGPGVQAPDSVQISSAGAEEYMFKTRSLRTRGYFSSVSTPRTGAGRFALRRILCHAERGHPATFVVERDHRYFYLVFTLRPSSTYRALAFRTAAGQWLPFRWDAARRAFTARGPASIRGAGRVYRSPEEPIEAAVGDTFEIALPFNPSTGYRWALRDSLPAGRLELVSHGYRPDPGRLPAPGSGGTEHWTFGALAPGEVYVPLVYARGGRGAPPGKRAYFRVVVRE